MLAVLPALASTTARATTQQAGNGHTSKDSSVSSLASNGDGLSGSWQSNQGARALPGGRALGQQLSLSERINSDGLRSLQSVVQVCLAVCVFTHMYVVCGGGDVCAHMGIYMYVCACAVTANTATHQPNVS